MQILPNSTYQIGEDGRVESEEKRSGRKKRENAKKSKGGEKDEKKQQLRN
jgi:hypothetical protein